MNLTINVSVDDKSRAVVASAANLTPIDDVEMLVLGNREPLVLSFCDSAGAQPSWVTDPSVEVDVGLGIPTTDGSEYFVAIAALSVSGNTRTGTLDLDTSALKQAAFLALRCWSGRGIPTAGFVLEVRKTSGSLLETLALQRVFVLSSVLPLAFTGDPADLALAVLYDPSTGRLRRPVRILPLDGGVPTGGAPGYVLAKLSAADNDVGWIAVSGTGSVTNFSFTDGAGFKGTVANPTTAPALSLLLDYVDGGTY